MRNMEDTILFGKSGEIVYTNTGTILKLGVKKPSANVIFWDKLAEHFAGINSARVCLSGGIDSQFSLQAAKKLGIDISAVTYAGIWQGTVVNAPDVVASQRYCQHYGIPLEIIDIDLYEFLNSKELIEYGETYKVSSPQIAAHLKFLSKLSADTPLIMGGEPTLLFTHCFSDNDIKIGTHTKEQYTRLSAPYYSYAQKNNLKFFKDIFYLDTEIVYLGFEQNLKLLKDKKIYVGSKRTENKNYFDISSQYTNQMNAMQYKTEFYRSFGVEIIAPILKNTGFESLKKHLASVSGVYNEFDIKYRFPLELMFKEKPWSKNLRKVSVLDTSFAAYPEFNSLIDQYIDVLKHSDNLKNLALYSFDF